MESLVWLLLTGLVCFGWGFASNYNQWSERAVNGSLVEIKGKIYKIVEVDVVERGGDQNTKNIIQAIESNGNRGGDQKERGNHE